MPAKEAPKSQQLRIRRSSRHPPSVTLLKPAYLSPERLKSVVTYFARQPMDRVHMQTQSPGCDVQLQESDNGFLAEI